MSRRASPAVIGAFVIGAAVLLTGLVIYVGAKNIFSKEETFLLYFDETVNGLAVGAPVKFKGVPIGRVSDVRIRYNQSPETTAIPVFIEIDTRRLEEDLGVQADLRDEEVLAAEIQDGLRGKLVVTSYISGQLYIELDYVQTPVPLEFPHQQRIEYKEIPTEPSVLAQVGSSASDIVARFSAIDMKTINDETIRLLRNSNAVVEALDVGAINQELVRTTQNVNQTLVDADIPALVAQSRDTLAQVQALATKLEGHVDPAMADYHALAQRLDTTLGSVENAANGLSSTVQPQSALYYELNQTMREVRVAARELRELADFLERNPRALLTGRDKPE
ncbi:MAG: MlaD family protein [Verrucomicrobiota bacterium JB022]|nr:MlaD family protein [Verrucomicrobiota bacterium JB022]